eukprot:4306392-Amphidinium_carterae.1
MKNQLAGQDEHKSKRLPPGERGARLKSFKEEYKGLKWSPQIDPAHTTVDKLYTMREDNAL